MLLLNDILSMDENLFGNKARRLALLSSHGLPVKPAVVITANEVRDIVEHQSVPPDIIPSILTRFRGSFAVRSAAKGEDGEQSWAGQFKTRLFVKPEQLEEAIIDCANASESESVRSYAQTFKTAIPPLTLIVQEMVDAELAGVLFTTNPCGSDCHVAIIEVISGVAESLVSGLVNPHRYYLDLHDARIIREENAEKPGFSTERVREIMAYGWRLRRLFSKEQDVEWAIEKETGKLYLNQSRDITTLDNPDRYSEESIHNYTTRASCHHVSCEQQRLAQLGIHVGNDVLSDQNIAELVTPHPTQMGFGLFTYCFAHGDGAIRTARNEIGYEIGQELEAGFFSLVGGQPRCSIVHDVFTYRIAGIPPDDYHQLIEYYLWRIHQDPSLANYPEVVLYNQNPSRDFLAQVFGSEKADGYLATYQRFFEGIQSLEDKLASECHQTFLPDWEEMIRSYQEQGPPDSLEGLSSRYQQLCNVLRTNGCRMFVKVARLGFFAYARLRRLLDELFGEEGEGFLHILTSGIPLHLNPNLAFNVELAKLRDKESTLEKIKETFGHLSAHELEISCPRYREQPSLLLELAAKINGDPLAEIQDRTKASELLLGQLLQKAGSQEKELAREVEMARTYLALREMVKFSYLKAYALLRTTAVRLGEMMGWRAGLVFHLDPRELFDLRDQTFLHELALERRAAWEAFSQLDVPGVIFTENLVSLQTDQKDDDSGNILRGIGVTKVVNAGEVVVIKNLDDREAIARLHPGSILVTATTDPAWSPMIAIVGKEGGLITEVGGILAHGSIYARELGLAAVVNVPNATRRLKTGMRVCVNGPGGYIEILQS